MRLGTSLSSDIEDYNKLSFAFDINHVNSYDDNALIHAVHMCDLEIVRKLIESKVDVNRVFKY